MAILNVLNYPDSRLHKIASIVEFVDSEIKAIIKDMTETIYAAPGIYEKVRRALLIKVKALNIKGEVFELEVDGKISICIQHEMDHLMGKVFVEYLSLLKKNRIKSKMIKRNKKSVAI